MSYSWIILSLNILTIFSGGTAVELATHLKHMRRSCLAISIDYGANNVSSRDMSVEQEDSVGSVIFHDNIPSNIPVTKDMIGPNHCIIAVMELKTDLLPGQIIKNLTEVLMKFSFARTALIMIDENDRHLNDLQPMFYDPHIPFKAHLVIGPKVILLTPRTLKDINLTTEIYSVRPYAYKLKAGGKTEGADVELLELLEKRLGFRIDDPKDSLLIDSRKMGNTTRKGIVTKTSEKVISFGISRVTITEPREKLVDYGPALSPSDIGFLAPLPKPVNSLYTMITPFDIPTWQLLAASLVFVTLFLFVCDLIFNNLEVWDNLNGNISIVVAAVLSEGLPGRMYHFQQSPGGQQFIVGVWLLLGTLLSFCYRSNLLSSLCIVEYEKPYDTIDDLLQAQIPLCVLAGTIYKTALSSSKSESYQRAYQELVLDQDMLMGVTEYRKNLKQITAKMDNGEMACMAITAVAMVTPLKHFGKEVIMSGFGTWVFPKHSRLRSEFWPTLTSSIEGDLMRPPTDRMKDTLIKKYSKDFGYEREDFERVTKKENVPISVTQLFPILIIVLLCYLLSIIIFGVEMLTKSCIGYEGTGHLNRKAEAFQ